MSSDVFIQIIRKRDNCPFERIYLGGNSLAKDIRQNLELEPTVMGCYICKIEDVETFLNLYIEQIERYGGYADLEDAQPLEDFNFWLVIES